MDDVGEEWASVSLEPCTWEEVVVEVSAEDESGTSVVEMFA